MCLFWISNKQCICSLIIYSTLMLLQTCFFCETQNKIFWRMFCPYNKYNWLWLYGQNRFPSFLPPSLPPSLHPSIPPSIPPSIHPSIHPSKQTSKISTFVFPLKKENHNVWNNMTEFYFGVTVIVSVYYFGVYISMSSLSILWHKWRFLSIHLKKKVSKSSGQCVVLI